MKRILVMSMILTVLVGCGQATLPGTEPKAGSVVTISAPKVAVVAKTKAVIQYYYAVVDPDLARQYPAVTNFDFRSKKIQCRHETQLDAAGIANLSTDYPGCQIFTTSDGKVNVGCPNCVATQHFYGTPLVPEFPDMVLPLYQCTPVKYDASNGADCDSLVLPYE